MLGQVRSLAEDALSRVREAEELWLDAAADLIQVLVGSEMVEVGELARLDDEVRRRFTDLGELLVEVVERLEAVQGRLTGTRAVAPPPEPATPAVIAARDGSQYPAGAAWCADIIPRRVVEKQPGEKTVGYVADRTIPFVSGRDNTWTPSVVLRMRDLKIGSSEFHVFLSSHVEMKVATMMIAEHRRYAELTINHVPCGSQAYPALGCHQVLERYLPKGYTLVVHGTTQQGKPFSTSYEGRA